jgi:hypothetical protein
MGPAGVAGFRLRAPRRRVRIAGAAPSHPLAARHLGASAAAAGAHLCLRARVPVILVEFPQRTEHPSPQTLLRRRSPSTRRRARVAAGRAPPLQRLRRTRTAGSPSNGPDRVNAPVKAVQYRST